MANGERQPIPNLFAEEDAKRIVTDSPTWENTLGFLAELTYPIDAFAGRDVDNPRTWLPPIRNRVDSVERYDRRLRAFSRYVGFDETMGEAGCRFDVTAEREYSK